MPAQKKTPRIGFGYDIHRLQRGRRLVLGGVAIPFPKGLLGHSDADVLCHAVADSILGAACCGDIGRHFPTTDPALRGISSLVLLERTRRIVAARGYAVVNIDSTVISQAPKVSPFINRMRANIATALGIDPGQVSVKATTNEGLGALGAGRGIAAAAVALVEQSVPRVRRSRRAGAR
jgi:2-C-methyl-D-erythritol 2,4-cyclodiphosphate synthase